jgi:hypothetical protein
MTINEARLLDITSGIATLFDKLKDIKLKLVTKGQTTSTKYYTENQRSSNMNPPKNKG